MNVNPPVPTILTPPARLLALQILRQMDTRGSLVNLALHQALSVGIPAADRHLTTEITYGVTRHQRTLDALIEQYTRRPISQQPPVLRRILQIGLYQLRHLQGIPAPIVVDTTVDLTRQQKLGRLTGVVNGVLRSYLRDPHLQTSERDPLTQLGLSYSYPDWILALWHQELPLAELESLCQALNQVPNLDLRVNLWKTSREAMQTILADAGIPTQALPDRPAALRVLNHHGDLTQWPGFATGLWTVQESSAQHVVELLDPQPGETIIDCCAAPGGKTTYCGERMANQGQVWALDHHAGRLKRVTENADRLGLTCIKTYTVDLSPAEFQPSTSVLPAWESADRVLLDAPCSGLGTLHRHADARWRQSLDTIYPLLDLQTRLLNQVCQWVKPGGTMVYATCTLNPEENQGQVNRFLSSHPTWELASPPKTLWPHREQQDGFYMACFHRP